MKNKLEIKSALIGAVLGVTVMVTVASAVILGEGAPVASRFRLINAGYNNDHLFKIDTMTGQVWETSASNPRGEFLMPNITLTSED